MVEVLGTFRVNKVNFWSANVQYMVLFLNDRLLFVKVGGQFADGAVSTGTVVGAVAGGAVGAVIGSIIGGKLDKSKREKKILETASNINRFSEMSADELVSIDKANYEIPYKNISKIEIQKSAVGANGPRTGTLSIQCAKKEKFDIAPNQDYKFCAETVKTLLADKIAS